MGTIVFGKERRAVSALSHMSKVKPYFLISKWSDEEVGDFLREHNFDFGITSFGYLGRSKPIWTLVTLMNMPWHWIKFVQSYFKKQCRAIVVLELISFLDSLPAILILKYFFHAKVIFYLGDIVKKYWPNYIIAGIINKLGDRLIANSKAVKTSLTVVGVQERLIQVIYNGVKLRKFEEVKGDGFRKRYGCPETGLLIGYAGQFRPNKGAMDFVKAAELVVKKGEKCHFVLIGKSDGENGLLQELMDYVNRKELQDHVTFIDKIAGMERVYRAFDIFVVPSRHEDPAPNVCIEAMAAGIPVIATRSGGIPELVADGETGFLVDKQNPERLADRILYLLQNSVLRKQMGTQSRLRVKRLFDIDKNALEVEKAISTVMTSNSKETQVFELKREACGNE